MNSYQSDPLLHVAKCEMCPQKVTNFVVGLCERCVAIWTSKRCMETMHITIDHVKAAIVSMSQNKTNHMNISAVFRRVIEEEQRRRKLKVELFQKLREKFQDGVLQEVDECCESRQIAVDENFYDLPLANIDGEQIEDLTFRKALLN